MSKNKTNEGVRKINEELGRGFDGISSQEMQRRSNSSRKVLSLCNILRRSSKDFGSTELVAQQLLALEKYFCGNYFDIQGIWQKYKNLSGKNIEKLVSGNEADVYILAEKDYRHVVKIAQWNAFSFRRDINQTPLEFLINKTVLHNTVFPDTFYKLAGACYNRNEFSFVFDQQYVNQLLDTSGSIVKADFDEIRTNMELRGFRLKHKSLTTYISEDYFVSDLHSGNVLKGADNELYYIDPVVRLNKFNRDYESLFV